MMKKWTALIISIVFAALFAVPWSSSAAGPDTHFAMTRKAVKKVSIPELRSLLEANKEALICGVSFPDFGTAIDYGTFHQKKLEYGSVAHKPFFVEAYFDHVMEKCAPDFEGCERLLAHFMGVAAHGMEDDLYDELFMNKAELLDPGGATVKHDLWADEVFIVKHDPVYLAPPYSLPVKDLVEVYGRLGMEVKKRDLRSGRFYHGVGAFGLRAIAVFPYPEYSKKMSFSRENIVSHPGGVDHTSEVMARYWEILWARLHGADRSEKLILETWPEPGASDHEWGKESLYSRVTVFFTTGMDQGSINKDSFYLQGPDGDRLPASYRIGNDKDNFTALIPEMDLEPGATYTAVITIDVKDMDGNPMPEPYSWSFTTSSD